MEELLNQLVSIARGMWRFRWPALIVSWIVGLLGAVIVFRIPDRYEALARIYVDTQSILKPLMSGLAVQPNVDQQLSMLSRTLISRPNIEKLVRMADLDLKSATKSQQEELIERLTRTVQIRGTGRDNLYSLTYVDSDKEKAKRVIQSMVSIFVESSLGASRKDTDSAKVFLDEQIKTYEGRLAESESRLKDFRLRNLDLQSPDGKDSAGRLAEISSQLDTARLQLLEAENAREAARRELAQEKASLGIRAGTDGLTLSFPTPELDARIDTQKRNLDQQLQRFTEAHPDVINARRIIRELEEQRRREVEEMRRGGGGARSPVAASGPSSPALLELSRATATSEVQVAALRARVSEYQTRLVQARAATKIAPQIEAEAAQLNRDYAIIKKNYEDLVARRQAASLSGDLDMASGVADFRLIDPPRVSQNPVAPNRLMLMPLALLAATLSGLGTAFVMSRLRPVFNDAAEIRSTLGLPLLGVVSALVSDEDRRAERRDNLRFYAGTGGLFASFLVALVTISILTARQLG